MVLTKGRKGLFKVVQVSALFLTFDEHIVNVYLLVLSDLPTEHHVDQLLISGFCILQPKGHYFVTVKPLISDESSLLLVFFGHLDLVIA